MGEHCIGRKVVLRRIRQASRDNTVGPLPVSPRRQGKSHKGPRCYFAKEAGYVINRFMGLGYAYKTLILCIYIVLPVSVMVLVTTPDGIESQAQWFAVSVGPYLRDYK